MRHPDGAKLALYAGGDLGPAARAKVALHLRRCAKCAAEAAAYASVRRAIASAAETAPAEIDWPVLATEMPANIFVGLEAGRCVDAAPQRRPRHSFRWNLGAALAGATLLFVIGFALNFPRVSRDRITSSVEKVWRGERSLPAAAAQQGVVLEASPAGPSMTANGSAMQMLAPRASGPVSVSVSLQDSVSARYVDSDSGQVTINKVYYEQ
jgi:hypothetical protein